MAPTSELLKKSVVQQEVDDLLAERERFSDDQIKELEALSTEIKDIKTDNLSVEKSDELITKINWFKDALDGLKKDVDKKNTTPPWDGRLDRAISRTEKMLLLTQDTAKQAQFGALHVELKILKETLDYINLNEQALWDQIVLKNKGNNTSDTLQQETDTKKRSRKLIKGQSEQDPSDNTYVDVKDKPKVRDLMRKMRSLGKQYEKLETISAAIPVIVTRIWQIEWELMGLSPDFAFDMNKNKGLDAKNDVLIKWWLLKSDGTPTEDVAKILQDANIAAKAAKSPNAAVHIYNDLSDKLATKIWETGWLTKDEAEWILSFAPWVLWLIYAPDLRNEIPGWVLQKIATLGWGGYILDKVLKNKSPELIAKYEKGKITTETVSTSGKEYYRLWESSEFKTWKLMADMIGGQLKDDQDPWFFVKYLKWGELQVTQMVNDFRWDGPINNYLKKDDNTIQVMSILEVMLRNGQEDKIQNGVEAYLNDIGLITNSTSSTSSSVQWSSTITMRSINNKYAEYVTQAQQIYTDLQKLGKYEITKLGAEKRSQIAKILAHPKKSNQEKVNQLIQSTWIIGEWQVELANDQYINEIKQVLGSSVIGATSPNQPLRYKWEVDENGNKITQTKQHEAFVNGMVLARQQLRDLHGGKDTWLTLRATKDAADQNQSDHLYIQNLDHKTEIMLQPNGSYVLQIGGNLLYSSTDPTKVIMLATVFNFAWTYIGKLGTDVWNVQWGKLTIGNRWMLDAMKSMVWISPTAWLDKINQLIEKISAVWVGSGNDDKKNLAQTIAFILNQQKMKSASGEMVPIFGDHGYQTDARFLAAGIDGEQAMIVGQDFENMNKVDTRRFTQKIWDYVAQYGIQWAIDMLAPWMKLLYENGKYVLKWATADMADGVIFVWENGEMVVRRAITGLTKWAREYIEKNLPWIINIAANSAGMITHAIIDLWDNAVKDIGWKVNEYLAILMWPDWDQFRSQLEDLFDGVVDFTAEWIGKIGWKIVKIAGWLFEEAWNSISNLSPAALGALTAAVTIWLKSSSR